MFSIILLKVFLLKIYTKYAGYLTFHLRLKGWNKILCWLHSFFLTKIQVPKCARLPDNPCDVLWASWNTGVPAPKEQMHFWTSGCMQIVELWEYPDYDKPWSVILKSFMYLSVNQHFLWNVLFFYTDYFCTEFNWCFPVWVSKNKKLTSTWKSIKIINNTEYLWPFTLLSIYCFIIDWYFWSIIKNVGSWFPDILRDIHWLFLF